MLRRFPSMLMTGVLLLVVWTSGGLARTAVQERTSGNTASMASPAYCIATHNVGNIAFGVSNNGTFGTGYSSSGDRDCFTGQVVPFMEFPKGSGSRYLFGAALWIGGVIGPNPLDTLVSVGQDGWTGGAEFHPDESPTGNLIYRSTIDPTRPEAVGAVSEQDYIAVYTDSFTTGVAGLVRDFIDGRPHIPLRVQVAQRSYAWSHRHAEDFVIFDVELVNYGPNYIESGYVGIFVDGDVYDESYSSGFYDDITGFVLSAGIPNLPAGCDEQAVFNLAWSADNDGDLHMSPTVAGVTATQLLHASGSPEISYNWWASNGTSSADYGPMTRDKFRDLQTGGQGTPEGDRSKYWYLSNHEIDFDQVYTGVIQSDDSVWIPPDPVLAPAFANGNDTRYLLSFGPYDLAPGDWIRFTFACVAGENFHVVENNILSLPDHPDVFTNNLDFTDLITNATWARWVFDNPGVDTDSDGYAGEYVVCEGDTIWTDGDGVPDFRAASAPAIPPLKVTSLPSALRLGWNGTASEMSRDIISRAMDFEGYNVYLSSDGTPSGLAVVASYDMRDYIKYYWDSSARSWQMVAERFTLEDLRCLYAPGGCEDPDWNPDGFIRTNPYRMPDFDDSVFYFEPIGCNAALFGWETPIVKSYPEATEPPYSDPSEVPLDSIDFYLTGDGYFKYYEYEHTIINLLPGASYWVSVTAFDYGSFVLDAHALESSPVANAVEATTLVGTPFCCVGLVGNVDGDPNEQVDIGDLTALIDYLFVSYAPPSCLGEANLDGDPDGLVDISDLTLLIDFLFISRTDLDPCR
ncbi:MAG: hypothetical protein JSU65_10205 [Candidatus Zixiibacteriota bacterium]|nr:MAG: hypothetical protein JSU65_10205 [candidate division Zixibacteria bacterium]